jgi:hypothetical protein
MIAIVGSACSGGGAQYPAEVIDNYMGACEAQGVTTASCACTLDHIQDEMSLDEFEREDARIVNGESSSDRFNEVMAGAIRKCA